ncbi:hypothetical protein FOA52_003764 [Chlamydomonas sp. UWO 241]|nr:hypothetical protein FOA52_003764 [Chlamydomonas sp. UWO 241]
MRFAPCGSAMRFAPCGSAMRLVLLAALGMCMTLGFIGPSLHPILCGSCCSSTAHDGGGDGSAAALGGTARGEYGALHGTGAHADTAAWPPLPPRCAPAASLLSEWAVYKASCAGADGGCAAAPAPMCVLGPSGACASLLRPSGLLSPCPHSADLEGCHKLPDARGREPLLSVNLAVTGGGERLAGALAVLLAELTVTAEVTLMLPGSDAHGNGRAAAECARPAAAALQALGLRARVCSVGASPDCGQDGDDGGGDDSVASTRRVLLLTDGVLLARGSLSALLRPSLRLPGAVVSPPIAALAQPQALLFGEPGGDGGGGGGVAGLERVVALPALCLLGPRAALGSGARVVDALWTPGASWAPPDRSSSGAGGAGGDSGGGGSAAFLVASASPALLLPPLAGGVPAAPRLPALQRTSQMRVLYVDTNVPTPDRDSGSRRTAALMALMAGEGWSVDFQPLWAVAGPGGPTSPADDVYGRQLGELSVRALPPRYPEQWPAEMRAVKYAIVFIARRYTFEVSHAHVRATWPGAQLVYDTVDLHFLREARVAMLLSTGFNGATNLATQGTSAVIEWLGSGSEKAAPTNVLRETELGYVTTADATLVVSEQELEVVRHYLPTARVSLLSNIMDVGPGGGSDGGDGGGSDGGDGVGVDGGGGGGSGGGGVGGGVDGGRGDGIDGDGDKGGGGGGGTEAASLAAEFSRRSGLLFVGHMAHFPNQQAVYALLFHVLPSMAEAARKQGKAPPLLHIVGSGKLTDELSTALSEAEGVVLHGELSDAQLEYVYASTRVALAPLLSGAGVKGKVNQAMALGVPVVATTIAVEGMHAVAGRDCLVAASLDEFARHAHQVYNDPALWARLSSHGRANVRNYFSPEVARGQLRAVVAELMGRRKS